MEHMFGDGMNIDKVHEDNMVRMLGIRQDVLIADGISSIQDNSMDVDSLENALHSCGILSLTESQMQDGDEVLNNAIKSCGILSLPGSQQQDTLSSTLQDNDEALENVLHSCGILSLPSLPKSQEHDMLSSTLEDALDSCGILSISNDMESLEDEDIMHNLRGNLDSLLTVRPCQQGE